MTLTTPQVTALPLYAGFWRRGGAYLLDSLILIIPTAIVSIGLHGSPTLATFVNVAIVCAYFAGFHSSAKQATLGKMAFGIKVTNLAGERIGIGRGIGRYFATWLSAMILAIGYLMAGFTQKKQALHDMIAATLVVNGKADPGEVAAGGGVMPITGGVMVMIILLISVPFIGIVAAIAIPSYQDAAMRVKVIEAVNEAAAMKNAVAQAHAEKQPFKTGSMPVKSRYVKDAQVAANGEVVVVLVPAVGNGGSIVLTPSIDPAGTMSWSCSGNGVPPRYLPATCR
jgi:uncharacterized RDD family membrane protein YckC/Tfp pilus assembly major pilin PilA